MSNNIKQLSSDDYHFLNDIETGFTVSNPMNNSAPGQITHPENIIVNNNDKLNIQKIKSDKRDKKYIEDSATW